MEKAALRGAAFSFGPLEEFPVVDETQVRYQALLSGN
jgi:hypothetical protein